MKRKPKIISEERIITVVQKLSNAVDSEPTFTNIANYIGGSLNDIKPSLDHYTSLDVLTVDPVNKQSNIWKLKKNNKRGKIEKTYDQYKIQLDDLLGKLSNKKIITTSKEEIRKKIESDYWKLIFKFENVSEFYVDLLIQKDRTNNTSFCDFLDLIIKKINNLIDKSLKNLFENRPPPEIKFLKKEFSKKQGLHK